MIITKRMTDLYARSLQDMKDIPPFKQGQSHKDMYNHYAALHEDGLKKHLKELKPFATHSTISHILLAATHLANMGLGHIVHRAAIKIDNLYKYPSIAEALFNIAIDGGIIESCHAMMRRADRKLTIPMNRQENLSIKLFQLYPRDYYVVKAAMLGDSKSAFYAARLGMAGKLELSKRHTSGKTYPAFAATMYAKILDESTNATDKAVLRESAIELLKLCRYRYARPELSTRMARATYIAHGFKHMAA